MTVLPKDVQRKLAKLEALEAGGVDNWEFYDESLTKYYEENEKEETAETVIQEILAIVCFGVEEPAGRGCGYSFNKKVEEEAIKYLLSQVEKFKVVDND